MNIIVTFENRPIYASKNEIFDIWKIGQALSRHSSFNPDFEEYKRNAPAFWGQLKKGYDVRVWVWNLIENDWIENLV
jgi:hypothetical protein